MSSKFVQQFVNNKNVIVGNCLKRNSPTKRVDFQQKPNYGYITPGIVGVFSLLLGGVM